MTASLILKEENIVQQIHFIRGEKVMLDFDLAQLYQVETRALKQAVKRNLESFPPDFMFVLTIKEISFLVSQNVIPSKSKFGGALPYVFTEQGVAMLSGILKSKRARQVHIAIMRAFVSMRKFLETHKELATELKKLETRLDKNDDAINAIFEAIRQLMQPPNPPRKKIGFKIEDD
ncbi:MAG: ORF6N domain-containing protein [Bacteroidia bacterium]